VNPPERVTGNNHRSTAAIIAACVPTGTFLKRAGAGITDADDPKSSERVHTHPDDSASSAARAQSAQVAAPGRTREVDNILTVLESITA
jgi:hypothetical protein